MEFCCGKESHLCSTLIASHHRVRSYRVTEEMDGDDVDTLNQALDAIDDAHKDGLQIFVWVHIPYRNSGKIRSMFSSWELIAQAVEEYQGCLALEWPDTCESWKSPFVKEHLQRHGKGLGGCPSSRVWKVATNCKPLLHSLSHASTCTHSEPTNRERHPYPAYFAVVVHQAVRSWVRFTMMGCTAYRSRE
eukprot:6124152-Amphidinium_carterae.1